MVSKWGYFWGCFNCSTLHGFAQIVAESLLVDYMLIYFARGDVVVPMQGYIQEALIIAQIQVDFATIVKHIDFSMLEGRKRARIYVYVGVDLDGGHFEATAFE